MSAENNAALANLAHTSNSHVPRNNPNIKSAETSSTVVGLNALWQHPYVDVFKHFKVLPVQDWKLNKKQGDISEVFVSAPSPLPHYLSLISPSSVL